MNSDRPSDPSTDAFVLPVAGLFADLEAGVGHFAPDAEFADAPIAVQLEVLAGWRAGIDAQMSRTLEGLYRQVGAALPGAQPSARLDGFLRSCRAMGLNCPPELERRLREEARP